MHHTRPLPDTHPEFTVTHHHRQGFTEYRVEHWRLARDGSGRVLRAGTSWVVDAGLWLLVFLVAVFLFFWTQEYASRPVRLIGFASVLTWLLWTHCTQVLHESLLVFPTLGIQLETHRGHPLLPTTSLSTTRYFIPLASLEDVVLHEGFQRWNVRYYLAALQQRRAPRARALASSGELGGIEVHVAFENVLPYFPVLRVVYLGVQQTLFPPPTRVVKEG